MLSFFLRFRQSILLFILLATSLILMTSHANQGAGFQALTSGLFEVTAAMESWLSSLVRGAGDLYHGHFRLSGVEKENRVLREEVAVLHDQLNRLQEIEVENKRIKALLKFQESAPYTMITGRVVGKSDNTWSRTLILDSGARAGVAKGMAVIRPEGVVGKVLSASPNYSLVQLLIDSNSAVPALVQRTRAQGIVEGKIADLCRIKYLDRLADIRKGDLVLSSGLGGVYPKGLVIGTVTSVQKKPYGLFQEVLVSPAVEFSRLEEAFVVKESRRPGDDQPFKSVQE